MVVTLMVVTCDLHLLDNIVHMSQQYRSRFTMKQIRRRPLWVAANRWRSSEAAKLLLAAGDDLLTVVARQEYHSTNKRWELWLSWIVSPLGQAGWQFWPFTDICLDAYTCMKVCFNGTLSNRLHVSELKTPHSASLLASDVWNPAQKAYHVLIYSCLRVSCLSGDLCYTG